MNKFSTGQTEFNCAMTEGLVDTGESEDASLNPKPLNPNP